MATEKIRKNNAWEDIKDNWIGTVYEASQASAKTLSSNTWTEICSITLNKGTYSCVGRLNGYGHGANTLDRLEIGIGASSGGDPGQRNSVRLATQDVYRINCTTPAIIKVNSDNTSIKLWATVQQGGKVADGYLCAAKIS